MVDNSMFHDVPAVGFNVHPVLVPVLLFVEVAEGEAVALLAQPVFGGHSARRGTIPSSASCMLPRPMVSAAEESEASDVRPTNVESEAILVIMDMP